MTDRPDSGTERPPEHARHPHHRGVVGRIRGYFLAGILVTAPLAITVGLARWFIEFVDGRVMPLIPRQYNPATYLPPDYQEYGIPGLGVLVIGVVITLIGWTTASIAGRGLIRLSERLLDRIPAVRSVYGAIKQILETVLANQSRAFRQAVLLEYPRRGLWAIGFVTGVTEGEVRNLTADETVNIFLPTTPNPTSGFLLFVPKKDLVFLDMAVEDAVKMVISGGIVTPPDTRPAEERARPKVAARTYEEVDILRESDGRTVLIGRPPPTG